ncbi:MAG TPA: hypothetical protein VMC10_10905 [Stellaceae bacterium]|nr:hypothetical protein [Stellaceae bacterium]
MSDEERVVAAAEAAAAGSLWPTYALRAWLGALLVQTHQAEAETHRLIETHEREIDRLRAQIKRSGPVIKSLNDAIGMVDEVLKRKRDTEPGSERSGAAQRGEKKK